MHSGRANSCTADELTPVWCLGRALAHLCAQHSWVFVNIIGRKQVPSPRARLRGERKNPSKTTGLRRAWGGSPSSLGTTQIGSPAELGGKPSLLGGAGHQAPHQRTEEEISPPATCNPAASQWGSAEEGWAWPPHVPGSALRAR